MTHKSKVNQLNLDSESAKELELDEQPKPTRKMENPTFPEVDSSISHSHRRIKGTRKAR